MKHRARIALCLSLVLLRATGAARADAVDPFCRFPLLSDDPTGVGNLSVEQKRYMRELMASLEGAIVYKDWEDLETYFNCHKQEGKSRFASADKEAIQVAARHYGIPDKLLFCLLLTESRFFDGARSLAGAVGMAQFTPPTTQDLKRWLQPLKPATQAKVERCYRTEHAYDSAAEAAECEALLERRDGSVGWTHLNAKFQAKGLGPISVDPTHRYSSIAMGAYYYQRLLKRIADHYGLTAEDPEMLGIRVLKLALAAYNRGPNWTQRRVAEHGRGIDAAVDSVQVPETREYMRGIERCMRFGEGRGPGAAEGRRKDTCPVEK